MALNLSVFAASAPPDPPTTTGPAEWSGDVGDQTLTVNVNTIFPTDMFAPLPVEWEVTVLGSAVGTKPALTTEYDPTFAGLHYVILTGNTGNFRNERLADAAHRNKAFAYGPKAGHVYSEPGTYTAYVFAYDHLGKWGVSEPIEFTVLDPDTIPSNRTIVIATDGDFTGAPTADAVNQVTTWAAAWSRWQSIKNQGVTRISAKAGSILTPSFTRITTENSSRVIVDTWGGSDKAVYTERTTTDLREEYVFNWGFNYAFKNWSFDMGWNVFKEAPESGFEPEPTSGLYRPGLRDFIRAQTEIRAPDGRMRNTYDNCDFEGFPYAIANAFSSDNRPLGALFFNDCLMQRNNDYLSFDIGNLFLLGTQIIEEYGVSLGCMGRRMVAGAQRGGRSHRAIRGNNLRAIYIQGTFYEARGGWSGQENSNRDTFYSPQNIFRVVGLDGGRYYYCDSVFIGTTGVWPKNNQWVVENCLLIADPAQSQTDVTSPVESAKGGTTLRNNQLLVLNTPYVTKSVLQAAGKNPTVFGRLDGNITIGNFKGPMINTGSSTASAGRPMEFLHNTAVMLKAPADINGTYALRETADDASYDVVEGHWVEYAPNLNTPIGPAMSTVAVPSGVRVLDAWMKLYWVRQEYFISASIGPSGQTGLIPYPTDWYGTQVTQANITANTSGNHGVVARTGGLVRGFSVYRNSATSADNGTPEYQQGLSVSLEADGFRLTNESAVTWDANQTLIIVLDRGNAMAADFVFGINAAEVALYRPTTPQALTPGVKSTLFDFARTLRPSAGFAISPAGTNAAGALLPA